MRLLITVYEIRSVFCANIYLLLPYLGCNLSQRFFFDLTALRRRCPCAVNKISDANTVLEAKANGRIKIARNAKALLIRQHDALAASPLLIQ